MEVEILRDDCTTFQHSALLNHYANTHCQRMQLPWPSELPISDTYKFFLQHNRPEPPPKPRLGFFSLPGEIRNIIYRLCFHKCTGSNKSRERWFTAKYGALDKGAVNPTTTFGAIWLLATCRLAHAEASGILYGENAFTLIMEVYHSRLNGIFLPDIPYGDTWPPRRHLGMVRRLDVAVKFWCKCYWWKNIPEMFAQQMREFRTAYDVVWNDGGK